MGQEKPGEQQQHIPEQNQPQYQKREEAKPVEFPNNKHVRNNKIFAGSFLVLQILFIVMYAIFVAPDATQSVYYTGLYTSTGIALLVLVGFGLYFTYLRNLQWSGLGFTLLITAMTFQFYFLVNGFWNKARLQINGDSYDIMNIKTYLSDELATTIDTQGNSAAGAFKCALSMAIAFAAIGGRGGPLEALLIVVFGTILYELNRQILRLVCTDVGGSMSIFMFGGFYGSAAALLLKICRHRQHIERHPNYETGTFNKTFALIGSAFIWVFIPILNQDVPTESFIWNNGALAALFAVSASVITSIAFSLVIHGKVLYRDLLVSPIAGGVMIGSSSIMIYNPMEAIILGIIAGALQTTLFNYLEKKLGNNPTVSNGVFFLFAIQGFLGGLASAVLRAIVQGTAYATNYDSLTAPNAQFDQRGQISGTFITLGISILTGLAVGAIIQALNGYSDEQNSDFYHDKAHWLVGDDGISNQVVRQEVAIEEGDELKGSHAYL